MSNCSAKKDCAFLLCNSEDAEDHPISYDLKRMDSADSSIPDLDDTTDTTTLTPITGVLLIDDDDEETTEVVFQSLEQFGDVYSSPEEDPRLGNTCGGGGSTTTVTRTITSKVCDCDAAAPKSLTGGRSTLYYLLADDLSAMEDTSPDKISRQQDKDPVSQPTESYMDCTPCLESCVSVRHYLDTVFSAIAFPSGGNENGTSFETKPTDRKSGMMSTFCMDLGSLSYSSLDDCASELSGGFAPTITATQQQDGTKLVGKTASCALPNGVFYCTIWWNHRDHPNYVLCIEDHHFIVWKSTLLQEEDSKVLLWKTPEEVQDQFVDAHGNPVDTVEYITDQDGLQRIAFFVKRLYEVPFDEEAMDETSHATSTVDNRRGSLQLDIWNDGHGNAVGVTTT
eukprot:scaffold725_cov133-Cylindrotheca_fusiformis.AAC.6